MGGYGIGQPNEYGEKQKLNRGCVNGGEGGRKTIADCGYRKNWLKNARYDSTVARNGKGGRII